MSRQVMSDRAYRVAFVALGIFAIALFAGCGTSSAAVDEAAKQPDPFADYVWPPPPDEARIRLAAILKGRLDVEGDTGLEKALIGRRAATPYERLDRPFGVTIDRKNRILVTDLRLKALVRFDREGKAMDVIGTTGPTRLVSPLDVSLGPDGMIYVADAGLRKVLAYDEDGKVTQVFGDQGDLFNPVDSAVSPDGKRLFVSDSKAHRITIFDIATGQKTGALGERGLDPGQFNFPSGIAFDPTTGDLFVVDQLNGRVQIVDESGAVIETFGALGIGYGDFTRPKDVAIDDRGFIYVTDAAFGNVQIFDKDLQLLTFVGSNGTGPGQFQIAGSIAVRGDEFVIVDQLNKRVQVFSYINKERGLQ